MGQLSGWLADFAHVLITQIDQVLERRRVDVCAHDLRFSEIDAPFGRGRPLSRIVMAQEGLARIGLRRI